jgi:hypothetical protein
VAGGEAGLRRPQPSFLQPMALQMKSLGLFRGFLFFKVLDLSNN